MVDGKRLFSAIVARAVDRPSNKDSWQDTPPSVARDATVIDRRVADGGLPIMSELMTEFVEGECADGGCR